jgi:hypothetical protein
LFFLEKVLKVDGALTNVLMSAALALATPFFLFFGWLSDKIGRKPVILGGCLIAALTYFPLFHALTEAANPALAKALATSPVTVMADPADCSFQFDPIGKSVPTTSCDIAKSSLASAGVSYANRTSAPGSLAQIEIGNSVVKSISGAGLSSTELATAKKNFGTTLSGALANAGYPATADPAQIDKLKVVLILLIMVIYVAIAYAPLAAILVEMFPTRIRYTSVSVSYNLAVGWIGGFLPAIAFAMVVASGNIYFGLWYPVAFTTLAVLIGGLFVRDTRGVDINN